MKLDKDKVEIILGSVVLAIGLFLVGILLNLFGGN
jgi:hypothetical protein